MRNESIVITRNALGQWSSYIGATGLTLGLIGWVWQGGFTPLIGGILILGGLGIGLWALMTPQEFRAFITGRQARHSTTAVFGTLLIIGIVALVYVVLQRAVLTLDMTTDQRFTISDASRTILRQITRPIRITGFYSPRALQQREIDNQFFQFYEVETNGLFSREYVDPDEEPAQAQRFGVQYDGQVFISYLNPDGSVDFNTLARVPRSESQERDMTQAIARLLISGTLKVYFEISHGELDITDGSQQGLSGINNGIQESGLITAPLNLTDLAASGGNIPDDASAIILARPTTDFSDAEIAVLDRYFKRGGAAFIMADALFNENAFLRQDGNFNRYLWATFGVQALDAVVVDPASSSETALDVVTSAVFPDNQIAQRLDQQNAPPVFRVVRAVDVSSTPPSDTPNGRVAMSSDQSYGETNLTALGETNTWNYDDGQDVRGPLSMVVWANNRQTGAKLLLVGDGDFVTNAQVLQSGNSILFTDGLSWLTGFADRINFGIRAYQTGPLIFTSPQQLDLIAFITVILLPGLVLATGLVVWTRRMRA